MAKKDCKNILDIMAEALDQDKISESAFRAFNKTYDPAKGNNVEAVNAMRKATTLDNFLRASEIESMDAMKRAIDDSEGIDAILNMFAPSSNAMANTPNIATRAKSIEGQLRRKTVMGDQEFATKVFDRFQRDPKANEELAKSMEDLSYRSEAYPELREMADGFIGAMEDARLLYNKQGGNIGDVRVKGTDQGYMPHSHNPSEMLALGKSGWKTAIRNKLDFKRMGYKSNTDADFETMLDSVYDTITSGGLNKKDLNTLSDGKRGRGKRLSNQRMEERYLHFNKGEWVNYTKLMNSADGGASEIPNTYNLIRTHIRGMSNDIATMQVMGVNPDKRLADAKQYAKDTKKFEDTLWGEGRINSMYNVAIGRSDMNLSNTRGSKAGSMVMGTFRSVMVAGNLGSASLASLLDTVTMSIASATVGNNGFTTLGKGFVALGERALKGGSASEMELFSTRIGMVSDAFESEIRNTRWGETGGGSVAMQKVANQSLRVSGLIAWTNAMRTAWKMELAGLMGDNFGKKLDDFTFGKRMKKQYGITEEQWASLGDAHKSNFKDGGYIDTTKIYDTDSDLAMKLQDLMEIETNYAVVMPDARTRGITTGGMAKGTVGGELLRTATMFKSFPIALMTNQIARYSQIEGVGGKVAYASANIAGLMAMGTAVAQLKFLVSGKEAMDWDEPELYKKGFEQGGALGVFTDLLMKPDRAFGSSGVESFFLGIGAKPLSDAKSIYDDAIAGKNPLNTAKNKALGYLPYKNLWYTKLALERGVLDRLKQMGDPKYESKLKRQKKKMMTEGSQGYWLPPTQ